MSINLTPKPDLCFRSETARLLALNVAQIQTGMLDGENSIEQIGDSFQDLASFCLNMQNKSECPPELKQEAALMYQKVNGAIVAFQFYDRLAQRLDHVQKNLILLSEILSDNEKLDNPDDWQCLRTRIKSSYSIDSEVVMYEAVMNGATITEAIEIFKKELNTTSNDEAIELF
ncbi:hypothetical protein [Psychrosphaera haliotis]|uniref:Uncharacterized protein n=1 Tax=Psychrosphaera haliotis TaxID=555083 RepID=A0A6N8F9S6_9GAMM|nr:hypothetical protein [Psychrosphaera haliotis]MUH73256.1 hypothetical protein [Psychrosphaera haliotis]